MGLRSKRWVSEVLFRKIYQQKSDFSSAQPRGFSEAKKTLVSQVITGWALPRKAYETACNETISTCQRHIGISVTNCKQLIR